MAAVVTISRNTPFDELPPWLTPREAAAVLGVSSWAVYQYVHSGEIPHRRIGKKLILIPKEYFDSGWSTWPPTAPSVAAGPRQ